jgi:hypothetical protein
MGAIFFSKVSPQNENYIYETFNNYLLPKEENIVAAQKDISIRDTPDSLLTLNRRKDKIAVLFLDSLAREHLKLSNVTAKQAEILALKRPEIPKDSIHTASFQWKRDTTLFQRQLYSYIQSRTPNPVINYSEQSPGKILAVRQSYNFLKDHENKIISGDGIGNFSSKLAFRATGLKMAGGFPQNFTYCNPDFLNNHLNLYAYFFLKNAHSHSIIHIPASVYDQLLTEYGFLGFLAFSAYYVGFFFRYPKKLSYGLPLVITLLSFFMVDYWFEQLSIVILFELLMFINIKEHTKTTEHE